MFNNPIFIILILLSIVLVVFSACTFKTLENLNRITSKQIHKPNMSFNERQILICKMLNFPDDLFTVKDLLNTWCNDNIQYILYANGEISFRTKNNITNNSILTNLNFLIEIIIILDKLKKEKIIYEKKIENLNDIVFIGSDIPNTTNIKIIAFETNIKSRLLTQFLTHQYYVDEQKLKKFIKDKYKTRDERKEANDKVIITVAVISSISAVLTFLYNILY